MGHQSVLKSMVLLVILASLAIYFFEVYQEKKRAPLAASEASKDAQKPTAVSVEVMTPKEGGLERTTTQPGTVRAYEYEEIFSQVSGKLANQTVDIGSRVKKGQVLADIDAPELLKDEEYAHAVHKEALARVEQMKAHWEAAKQDWEAAKYLVGQRRAEVRRATSNRKFREIMYERIKKLNEAQSVDDKLVDAKFEERDSARAWEEAANLAIKTAEADVKAKAAKIDQAKADLLEARAKVEVATAAWDKARVFVQFTKIVSSYDGVVTRRSYHNGDFISEGKKGQSPLLMVQRTDLMRVLVSVPDVDVPYLREGDPAELLIESLPPERKFSGYDERKHQLLPSPRVSRISRSQDLTSRTMPIEIDVPNNDDLLCDGMYGAVTIHLRAGSLSALTLPSSSLVHPAGHEDNKPAPKGKRQNGHAWVYVVRDGRAKLTPVKVGLDSGSEVEIISGLNRDDLVVIQAEGALADGTPVLVPSQEGTFHGGLH